MSGHELLIALRASNLRRRLPLIARRAGARLGKGGVLPLNRHGLALFAPGSFRLKAVRFRFAASSRTRLDWASAAKSEWTAFDVAGVEGLPPDLNLLPRHAHRPCARGLLRGPRLHPPCSTRRDAL